MTHKSVKEEEEFVPTDAQILHEWHRYAAQQSWSVGALLQLLRTRQQKSEEEQRLELEVSTANFTKLQGMSAPRPDQFYLDGQRIAQACHVVQEFQFIQMLMLARNLAVQPQHREEDEVYEAAFDALPEDSEDQ